MVNNLYYNVFRKSDDKFMGTVAVRLNSEMEMLGWTEVAPSIRACVIAESKLVTAESVAPVGLYAVLSTKEMHLQYGLN